MSVVVVLKVLSHVGYKSFVMIDAPEPVGDDR